MSISALGSFSSGSGQFMELVGKKDNNDNTNSIESFLSQNDSDGDSLLTLEESGLLDEHFENLDSDEDGYLSIDELEQSAAGENSQLSMLGQLSVFLQSGSDEIAGSIISESDSDGDGEISFEESGLSEDLFSMFDSDSDGSITSEEIISAIQGEATDPASNISADSFSGVSSVSTADEDYDSYDFNKDGVVTADELRQAFEAGDQSLSGVFDDLENEKSKLGTQKQDTFAQTVINAYSGQNQDVFSSTKSLLV
ncbi:EF-hand domain-containing protein [Maridesulfovibrio bastinii]|uniref:EF-hand domain-containing protein n=1 Tax=Maridesulfovibrio bastinii TaxID=47157 RepID=UPI0003F6745F|nr:EF-hand domain-containing protein [Maridesulfovibrio bastinii]